MESRPVGADMVHADRQTDRWTDGQAWRRQEALFASMRARLERQRTKTGTVTWSVTVLLFCHVNAVMTGNSNCQYSASTCWETSGVSIFRLPHCCWLQVSMHPEGPATDRPTDQLDTGFLASCVLHTNAVTVPEIPSCYRMTSVQPSQFKCIKMSLSEVHKLLLQISNQFRSPLCSSFRPLHFHSSVRRTSGRSREPADQVLLVFAVTSAMLFPFFCSLAASDVPPFSSCVKVNAEV